MDSNVVLNTSAVGEHIRAELRTFSDTMTEQLRTEGEPIQGEIEAFRNETAALDRAALQERTDLLEKQQELQQRLVDVAGKEQMMRLQLSVTQDRALATVSETLNEVLQEVVDERGADLLMEREMLIYAGDAVDVTQAVIDKLNERLATVDVALVSEDEVRELVAAAQQAQAAAAQ